MSFSVDTRYSDVHNGVMAKLLSSDDVIGLMKRKQGTRTMRGFSRDLGLSVAYLSDFYHGRRMPGPAILKHLGVEKVETELMYRRKP